MNCKSINPRKITPNRFINSAHIFRSFPHSFSTSLRARTAADSRFQNSPLATNSSCNAFSFRLMREMDDFRDESDVEKEAAHPIPREEEEAEQIAVILQESMKEEEEENRRLCDEESSSSSCCIVKKKNRSDRRSTESESEERVYADKKLPSSIQWWIWP